MDQTEAFRLLASADRQLVLHELCERDGRITVDELAERVAVRRHRLSTDAISDEQVERAYVRLVHTHLPQLVANGVISRDSGDDTVVLRDDESVASLFEAAEEIDGWPPDDLLEESTGNR